MNRNLDHALTSPESRSGDLKLGLVHLRIVRYRLIKGVIMNVPDRKALLTVLGVLTFSSLALAHWGVPELPRGPRGRSYPAARHGGNYMHNYYFPPAPSSTP